ncbi:hypothetical protein M569_11382, partial [Genlisea aurea]
MGDLTGSGSGSAQASRSRQVPFREDCWTEEATATLVDVWGRRYMELNRGNLRQKDWQEVADVVNSRHGHTKKTRRTDVQCKNRIDTLKKKYKTEKAKIVDSNGAAASSWPFFSRLDFLIGSNLSKLQNSKATPPPTASPLLPSQQGIIPMSLPSPPMAVPINYRKPLPSAVATPMVLPQKRSLQFPSTDESFLRRNNYSVMAAAAAAAADDDGDGDGDSDGEDADESPEEEEEEEEEESRDDGLRRLAKAVESLGEIYERVESLKQRQIMEMEKERMQIANELEAQRISYFTDFQVRLEKIKQAKRS